MAIKYFDKAIGDPVGYEITDEMIIEYSKQFEHLRQSNPKTRCVHENMAATGVQAQRSGG